MTRPGCPKAVTAAVVMAAALALEAGAVWGQVAAGGAPAVAAAAARSGPIRIDGRPDEAAWAAAVPASGLVQVQPREGEPGTPTDVWVLYDASAIYVGARMWDSAPDSIGRFLEARADGFGAYDYFEISFDTNNDELTAYSFGVTAGGMQVSRYNYNDTNADLAWKAVWESAVAVDSAGWTAELRIPLSQMRYTPSATAQSWGLQITRRRMANNERSDFAWSPRSRRGWVSRLGRLDGLVLPDERRHFEMLPYVLTRMDDVPGAPGDPFVQDGDTQARAGLDLRTTIGSALMLDIALNPDFGQVELDPAVINLTAFETFLPERRPFFSRDDRMLDFLLEGGRDAQPRLFYSRRIGRTPQRPAPAADFADAPTESRILGAAKVTGRTRGGLTLGALAAVTAEERGRIYSADRLGMDDYVAEPRTTSGVVRLQQDLAGGTSRVGGMLTAMERALPESGEVDFLARRALTGGIDFEYSWANRSWAFWGFLAASHVTGSPEAITTIQRSAGHYYQRPDQDYMPLDSQATAISGAQWRLQLEKRSGEHWTGGAWLTQRTPGFEINDIGFSRGWEGLTLGTKLAYEERRPSRLVRSYGFAFHTSHDWRNEIWSDPLSPAAWGDAVENAFFSLTAQTTLHNWWSLDAEVMYKPAFLMSTRTRGGPLMLEPVTRRVYFGVSSDTRGTLSYGVRLHAGETRGGGSDRSVSGRLTFRPVPQMELELAPRYDRRLDIRHYVTVVPEPDYAPTYGARYVFSDLDHRTFSMETRLNLVLSPTLSLELYAQPLISSGENERYKLLRTAGTFDFDTMNAGDLDENYDFNIRELRGNAVLRWEYRPGSQLYLVWQQRRHASAVVGDFDPARDFDALLGVPAENTLLLKVSYWFGR